MKRYSAFFAVLLLAHEVEREAVRCFAQEEDLVGEIREKCKSHRAIAKFIQGEVVSKATFFSKQDGKETVKQKNSYKQNAESVLMVEKQEHHNGSIDETVYGMNPKYGFVLERPAGKTDWIIQSLFLGDPAKVTYGTVELREHVLNNLTLAYPREMISGPWKITKSRRLKKNDGDEQLVLEFEDVTEGSKIDAKGAMTFSPKLGLAMARCDVTNLKISSTSEVTQFYSGTLKGFSRIAKRVVAVSIPEADGGVITGNTVTDYDLRYDESVPDIEFTLSAFGLPEPKGISWDRPAQRGWIWWGAAGIALIATGYGANRWRQRKASSIPSA